MQKNSDIADMGDWEVENIRLTAFTTSSSLPDRISWWQDLFNDIPDSSESRPKEGIHREKGVIDGYSVILNVQPNRVDWLYSYEGDPTQTELPTIGRFDVALKDFTTKIGEWLKISPPIIRLAFGAVLLRPTESREQGYTDINESLPSVDLDADGSFDFAYQINRPRISKVMKDASMKLNRLSKWSVVRVQTMQLAIGGDDGTASRLFPFSSPSWACRLELDISTDQNSTEKLSGEILSDLFAELVELGTEISKKGDIP